MKWLYYAVVTVIWTMFNGYFSMYTLKEAPPQWWPTSFTQGSQPGNFFRVGESAITPIPLLCWGGDRTGPPRGGGAESKGDKEVPDITIMSTEFFEHHLFDEALHPQLTDNNVHLTHVTAVGTSVHRVKNRTSAIKEYWIQFSSWCAIPN